MVGHVYEQEVRLPYGSLHLEILCVWVVFYNYFYLGLYFMY